jgi:phosphoglycolate phosphatase-like HAD superfamily hydrolase
MREALESLRTSGYQLGIVTSKLNALARRGLVCTGIDGHIECIIGCDDTTKHKPDPEPVFVALAKLGVAPERAAFVGDSPFDIAAGNAAGVYSVGALWGPFPRSDLELAVGGGGTGARAYAERPQDVPIIVADWVRGLASAGATPASGTQAAQTI